MASNWTALKEPLVFSVMGKELPETETHLTNKRSDLPLVHQI